MGLMMRARKQGDSSAELQNLLLGEFQKAEQSKQALNLSHNAGQSTAEAFALNVFDAAENADKAARDSSSQGGVVAKFYAAALFLDVCAQFYDGELPPDLAEKARYARFRVVQIREGLKSGSLSFPEAQAASSAQTAPVAAAMAPVAASGVAKSATAGGRTEAKAQLELASSALDFNDAPTARKCLQEALRHLG
ncbi:unnamed protein product [Effrenium voratum]|nr:unnamed protein product [Effrenium voratum]